MLATENSAASVRLVRAGERKQAAAQTAGMIREEAFFTDNAWAGIARTQPGNMSGWHHHGDWETIAYVLTGAVKLECGPGGQTILQADPGDYLYIPKGEIHRESNPTEVEQSLVIVRMGSGPVVINVERPREE